jgi:formiminotetrahydrofolate cyclodeaminase
MTLNDKVYRLDNGKIVDDITNIVVCSEVAMEIARLYNIKINLDNDETSDRINAAGLNNLLNNLLQRRSK